MAYVAVYFGENSPPNFAKILSSRNIERFSNRSSIANNVAEIIAVIYAFALKEIELLNFTKLSMNACTTVRIEC